MEKTIYIILFLLSAAVVSAQQLPIFTQYNEYKGLIDPSFIPYELYEEDFKLATGVAYRDQWIQLPDRPRTAAMRYEGITDRRRGVNLVYGAYFLHDDIGVFETNEIKGRIATKLTLRDGRRTQTHVTAGVTLGVGIYSVNLADKPYIDGDPILFRANTSEFAPDAGIGVSVYNRFKNLDYLQVGVSIPQLLNLDQNYTNEIKDFDVRRVPHFYLSTSYYKILKGAAHLEFSGWVKKLKNVPINYDLVVRYKFDEKMWVGAGLNSSGLIHTEIGMNFYVRNDNRFKVGYSFNPTFKTHSVIFGNIHELNLSYYIRN